MQLTIEYIDFYYFHLFLAKENLIVKNLVFVSLFHDNLNFHHRINVILVTVNVRILFNFIYDVN